MTQPSGSAVSAPTTHMISSKVSRMWVGGILLAGGLGLVVLGGCFLIGIWIMIGAHGLENEPWGTAGLTLLYTLYAIAFACILGAAALITIAVKSLLALLKA